MYFLGGQDERWLELGVGTGRLHDACLSINAPSAYVGVEKDLSLLSRCESASVSNLLHADVLIPEALTRVLGDEVFTRSVGNPPYGCIALSDTAQRRINALCPGLNLANQWASLDLYFVLESLARLRRPGQAGFIVSEAIAADVKLAAFRKNLIDVASEVLCYELPIDTFGNKAEVQSYMLVAKFGRTRRRCTVKVGRLAGLNFDVVEERSIHPDAGTARLDLGYHKFADLTASLQAKTGSFTMRELGASIIRGSRTHHQFLDLEVPHFHTSDFPPGGGNVEFDHIGTCSFQLACKGDILVPRVGTRCLDRHALVATGSRPYTEAVYRVRAPSRYVDRIASWIGSDVGTEWRMAAAKGACAKHLTVSALMQMPVLGS
jgi:hypothetical protein